MAKTKAAQPDKAIKSSKDAQVKSLSSIKQGAVTKPSQTLKSKSKDIAKQVAVKADKVGKEEKKSKKAKKEPTPEPSTSESEDEEEEEESSSASSASSDESEAEVPAPKVAAKTNGVKTNGVAKAAPKAESDDGSDSSDSSESSDDETGDATVAKSASAAVANTVAGAKEESEGEEDSSEDDEESDEESGNKGPVDAKALNGKLEVVASQEVRTMIIELLVLRVIY